MPQKIVYFDNAATSFPKPESVYKFTDKYLRIAANPGRGAHVLAMSSAHAVHESRLSIAEALGIQQAERLVFTPGCTHSINMVLKGFPFEAGDTVIVSALEHNAVMRPLRQLERKVGIKIHMLPYAQRGIVDLHDLVEATLQDKPRMCIFSEASNITGEIIDLASIAAICAANKAPLLLDAAQSAGRSPHNIEELGISYWCASGHKGLFGPPGVGLLFVNPNADLEPIVAGGTGSNSEALEMPDSYPDHLEAGTMPGPAIAGLGAASIWLKQTTLGAVYEHEIALVDGFLQWALGTDFIKIAGNRQMGAGTAVVSFEVEGFSCDKVAHILDTEFGIAVRSGLHCAAAAHEALGTLDRGLVRVSFSYFNTEEEVGYLCEALQSIASRRGVEV
jgi:cysteine desulfurase family protein